MPLLLLGKEVEKRATLPTRALLFEVGRQFWINARGAAKAARVVVKLCPSAGVARKSLGALAVRFGVVNNKRRDAAAANIVWVVVFDVRRKGYFKVKKRSVQLEGEDSELPMAVDPMMSLQGLFYACSKMMQLQSL